MLLGLFTRRQIRNLSDAELIDLVRKNNSNALGELFQRYSPLVMGLCVKYMKNVPSAEDIMMELFEKLPEKVSKAEILNFKNWLYSVSRNECLMALRKKSLDTSDLEKVQFVVENQDHEHLESKLKKESEYLALESAIQELKNEQRQCIDLFYLKKRSYEEITTETGYELKKVKSYIQNGKRNLKLILEKKGEFE